MDLDIESPKPHRDGDSRWYPYYAGYSEGFLDDILKRLNLPQRAKVLDPWNGSGTTTAVARRRGFEVVGFDINPALVIVAKARMLDRTTVPSFPSLAEEIVSNADSLTTTSGDRDALRQWFSPLTASYIRAIERASYLLLIDQRSYKSLYSLKSFHNVSSLAALFYVALFSVVRSFLAPFRCSNPTWIRTANTDGELLTIPSPTIRSSFIEAVKRQVKRIANPVSSTGEQSRNPSHIDIGDSHSLPVKDQSMDAIITSPPYCTRIDYVIATLPELAIIGSPPKKELKLLRDRMIGTPTIAGQPDEPENCGSSTAAAFLKKVRSHASRASSTYYFRHLQRYFGALSASFLELDRTLKDGSAATIVVQDSYYKDIHNHLSKIVSELAGDLGWRLCAQRDFSVRNSLRAIRATAHTRPAHATESVLIFTKNGRVAEVS